jgi:hypothetical protein
LQNVSISNFNIKSFYSGVNNELYTFYRQGICVQETVTDFEKDAEVTEISGSELG